MSTTFVDHVSLVQGMGTTDKESLLQTLDFTIPQFAKDEMDRRKKISMPWYGVPLRVLSQTIDPVTHLNSEGCYHLYYHSFDS